MRCPKREVVGEMSAGCTASGLDGMVGECKEGAATAALGLVGGEEVVGHGV